MPRIGIAPVVGPTDVVALLADQDVIALGVVDLAGLSRTAGGRGRLRPAAGPSRSPPTSSPATSMKVGAKSMKLTKSSTVVPGWAIRPAT